MRFAYSFRENQWLTTMPTDMFEWERWGGRSRKFFPSKSCPFLLYINTKGFWVHKDRIFAHFTWIAIRKWSKTPLIDSLAVNHVNFVYKIHLWFWVYYLIYWCISCQSFHIWIFNKNKYATMCTMTMVLIIQFCDLM